MTADPIWKVRNVPPETRRRAVKLAGMQGLTVAQYLSLVINADYEHCVEVLHRLALTERTPPPN